MATVGDDHDGVHNLQEYKHFEDAKSQPGLMVIDAFATWCGPCKMISPKIVEFSKMYKQARFYKIDVDEMPDLSQELKIKAMPTFLLFKDGELFETIVGANPKAIENAIQKGLEEVEAAKKA